MCICREASRQQTRPRNLLFGSDGDCEESSRKGGQVEVNQWSGGWMHTDPLLDARRAHWIWGLFMSSRSRQEVGCGAVRKDRRAKSKSGTYCIDPQEAAHVLISWCGTGESSEGWVLGLGPRSGLIGLSPPEGRLLKCQKFGCVAF